MRSRFGAVALMTAFVVMASLGCSKKGEPAKGSSTLKLGIITWVGYTPLYLAQEKGFFASRGLNVEFVKLEDSAARRSALASGQIDVSTAILDEFAAASAAGLDARVFLKVDDSMGADGIVAKPNVTAVADLKGKTVAFAQGSPSHHFLVHVLKDAGLTTGDITPKYMEAGDAGAAFLSGGVDAAVTWEPWLSKAASSGNGKVLVTSRDKPGLIVDVLLAHPKVAADRSGDLKKLAEAWFEALKYYQANPDESVGIMAKSISVSKNEFESMVTGVRYADLASNQSYVAGAQPTAVADLTRANRTWIDEKLSTREIPADSLVLRDVVASIGK